MIGLSYDNGVEKNYIKKISLSGMLIAVGYVVTVFLSVPYASYAGYFNFGDVITILSSVILGPCYGAFIGATFSAMADLSSGYAQFVPFTIFAKALMGILVGFLHKIFPKKLKIIAFFISSLAMVAVYFVAYWIYYGFGSYLLTVFDLIQGLISSILAYLLFILFDKIPKSKTTE